MVKSAYSFATKVEKIEKHIIVVWVDNEAGVLARVLQPQAISINNALNQGFQGCRFIVTGNDDGNDAQGHGYRGQFFTA